jgi:hypothetical protein
VAVRTSREIVIEAPREAIMDALADVEALLSDTPAYRGPRSSTGTMTAVRTTCASR